MSGENSELIRRFEDLSDRAERRGVVTGTGFLTPAEQHVLGLWLQGRHDVRAVITGGREGCERRAAFFLPDWMQPEELDLSEYLRAVRIEAHFGVPGHRDYMGAALGLRVRREWLGDILAEGETAYIFCLPSVQPLLIDDLKKAGRVSLTVQACALSDVPLPERKTKSLSFTVKSLRLDAVAGSMFGLSRTAAAELIRLGAASLNYAECMRPDAPVKEGDVISLRGRGKGSVKAVGGRSKKDRLFIEAEVLQ